MTTLWIAVPAALVGAASFGLSGAMQHRAARTAHRPGTPRTQVVADIIRHPLWLLSLLCNGLAVIMQWLALATGPLIMVQSLLVTAVLFGVLASSALRREAPGGIIIFGALLCIAGLAAFLTLAKPDPGEDRPTLGGVLPLAIVLAVILAGCLVLAARRRGRVRVLALATATGILYGITAGLAKLVTADLAHGIGTAVTDWPLYFVLISGPAGFILNQTAFRAGVAVAPALSVIVALEPLVGIAIGVLWLGETLQSTHGAVLGECLAILVLLGGVVVLSRHSPQAAAHPEKEEKPSPVS